MGGGFTFYAISNISRNKNLKEFLEYKTIISHLMFSSCFFMLEILKSALHLQLLVKWEVVSPNSRYREF